MYLLQPLLNLTEKSEVPVVILHGCLRGSLTLVFPEHLKSQNGVMVYASKSI